MISQKNELRFYSSEMLVMVVGLVESCPGRLIIVTCSWFVHKGKTCILFKMYNLREITASWTAVK